MEKVELLQNDNVIKSHEIKVIDNIIIHLIIRVIQILLIIITAICIYLIFSKFYFLLSSIKQIKEENISILNQINKNQIENDYLTTQMGLQLKLQTALMKKLDNLISVLGKK